jgi:hypothetical protein
LLRKGEERGKWKLGEQEKIEIRKLGEEMEKWKIKKLGKKEKEWKSGVAEELENFENVNWIGDNFFSAETFSFCDCQGPANIPIESGPQRIA